VNRRRQHVELSDEDKPYFPPLVIEGDRLRGYWDRFRYVIWPLAVIRPPMTALEIFEVQPANFTRQGGEPA